MQMCGYAGVQVCRYAGMSVCRYAGMSVCRYAGVQVCRCAGPVLGSTLRKGLPKKDHFSTVQKKLILGGQL